MRIQNRTPFLVGRMATSLRPPQPSMTLVVKASFRLRPGEPASPLDGMGAQGSLSGDIFDPNDDDRRGALLYASDFADFKPRVDILLRGQCHTPGRKPLHECPIRFSVGAWSKILRVVGPRIWVKSMLGDIPSEPAAFTSMPIDLAHAFGGKDHPENPAGKGFGTDELHNIELPGDVVRGRSDHISPASFAPLSPFWPARRAKVGKAYGGSYQDKRAPYVAEDFDWTYFQSAPIDQQVDSLHGDEELTFTNLHPSAPAFSARLPGLRVRAFVNDERGAFREVSMRIDTLIADIEAERLTLVWRGLTDVHTDDLADVRSTLVASEPLASEPVEIASYRADLAAFEADPIGINARRAEILQRAGLAEEGATKEPAPDEQSSRAYAALAKKIQPLPAEHRETLRAAIERASGVPVAHAAFDRAVVDAVEKPTFSKAPIAMPRKPGTLPYVPLGREMRSIREATARVRATFEEERFQAATKGRDIDLSFFDKISAIEKNPTLRQLDPYTFSDHGVGSDVPGPGADLSGRDLSGADLRDRDLRGANLSGAILQGANLSGANLSGAKLVHAIFHRADLTGANLSEADLTLANLGSATLSGASMRGANLNQTSFERALLERADLRSSKGEYTAFSGATLAEADARGAHLTKAFFDGATLNAADFSRSTLTSCRFSGANAARANFEAAHIDRSSFNDADLSGARLVAARGDRVGFLRANLSGADLSRAILPDAFFDEARAAEMRGASAVFRRARFYRVDLSRADLRHADLFEGDLRKANLSDALLSHANLYAAQLRLTQQAGCNFDGANRKNVIIDGREPHASSGK